MNDSDGEKPYRVVLSFRRHNQALVSLTNKLEPPTVLCRNYFRFLLIDKNQEIYIYQTVVSIRGESGVRKGEGWKKVGETDAVIGKTKLPQRINLRILIMDNIMTAVKLQL